MHYPLGNKWNKKRLEINQLCKVGLKLFLLMVLFVSLFWFFLLFKELMANDFFNPFKGPVYLLLLAFGGFDQVLQRPQIMTLEWG